MAKGPRGRSNADDAVAQKLNVLPLAGHLGSNDRGIGSCVAFGNLGAPDKFAVGLVGEEDPIAAVLEADGFTVVGPVDGPILAHRLATGRQEEEGQADGRARGPSG